MNDSHQKIKSLLLEKLNVTPQALSGRISTLRKTKAITTEQGIYLIAMRENIRIDRILDEHNLDKINALYEQIYHPKQVAHSKVSTKKKETKSTTSNVIIKYDKKTIESEPLFSKSKSSEIKKMAEVFTLLYVLENSIRKFLVLALEQIYGENWWGVVEKKGGLKKKVEDRKKNEDRNPWHQKRSQSNIDYLDFIELTTLVNRIDEKLVENNIMPRRNWLNNLIEEVYESRCVLCHMNPLDSDNIQLVNANFNKWTKQIKAKQSLIRSL